MPLEDGVIDGVKPSDADGDELAVGVAETLPVDDPLGETLELAVTLPVAEEDPVLDGVTEGLPLGEPVDEAEVLGVADTAQRLGRVGW